MTAAVDGGPFAPHAVGTLREAIALLPSGDAFQLALSLQRRTADMSEMERLRFYTTMVWISAWALNLMPEREREDWLSAVARFQMDAAL